MKKSDVNGDNTNPVFQWLKTEKPGLMGLTRIKVRYTSWGAPDVPTTDYLHSQWNFEKFLIDKNGQVVNRWASTTTPQAIDATVEKLFTE